MRVGMGYDVHKLVEGCLGQQHLEISESIFRIRIRNIKGFQA